MSSQLIIIEGLIGVGKSTLAVKLAKQLNYHLIKEPVVDNPYLDKFYTDPKRYALEMQFWLMSKRFSMHQEAIKIIWQKGQGVIMDKAYEGSALRRVFTLVSGGNTQTIAVFRAFNEFPHWSDQTNQSWEEMYNEEFGWNQLEIDSEAFNNSILEWSTNTILMERVDSMMPN